MELLKKLRAADGPMPPPTSRDTMTLGKDVNSNPGSV